MSERVTITRVGAVAHVRLNRPDKRNALDLAMFEAIIAAGESLITDRSVRAVVLSGEGKAFSAGLDVSAFGALAQGDGAGLLARGEESLANVAQRVAYVWREVPVPVIAAAHGFAFGGGFQIFCGADIRYAHPELQLSVMEIKWGLIPDMGLTTSLVGRVPMDALKELTFTGRVFGPEEALRLGVVTRVCDDPLEEALETAAHIATRNPDAIRAGKALLEQAPLLDDRAKLLLETELQLELIGSKNQMEQVQANMAKRAPVFEDPQP